MTGRLFLHFGTTGRIGHDQVVGPKPVSGGTADGCAGQPRTYVSGGPTCAEFSPMNGTPSQSAVRLYTSFPHHFLQVDESISKISLPLFECHLHPTHGVNAPDFGSWRVKKMTMAEMTVPHSSAAEVMKLNFDHHRKRCLRSQYSVDHKQVQLSHGAA